MSEIVARIAENGTVELTQDGTIRLSGADLLSAEDALFLARNLIACALALTTSPSPSVGEIISDAHIPITEWVVGTSKMANRPALVLGAPHGLQMTFVTSEEGAIEIGQALVKRGQSQLSPAPVRGTVH